MTESGGQLSSVLKVLDLPTVDFRQCRNASPSIYQKYITSDKFCAGHLTGESVCQGDSGGGLVIPRRNRANNTDIYYLYGIVSNSPAKQGSCDNTKYTIFTNVYIYLSMLKEYYFDYMVNNYNVKMN